MSQFAQKHLLDIERLCLIDVKEILDRADVFVAQNSSSFRKSAQLAGKTVVNLFYEPSTRTRTSFELAAKRLGADVINVSVDSSSVKKGESLSDTIATINAMQVDAIVIRHKENGVPQFIAPLVKGAVLNAGDGSNEHPTQALLDAYVMRQRKGKLEGLRVVICGDIEHSRVARSNINLLKKFGVDVRLVAPSCFYPRDVDKLGVPVFETMEQGIENADVVMMLRIQHERLAEGEFAMSLKEYHDRFGLNHAKLSKAKPDVMVMHPGPFNRNVEVTSAVIDDPKHSVVLEQVEAGVGVRMACLDLLIGTG